MLKCSIYKIVSKADDKAIYVGSTKHDDVWKRWAKHIQKMRERPNRRLYAAMRGIGLENLEIRKLYDVEAESKHQILAAELEAIEQLDCFLNGCNMRRPIIRKTT